MIRVLPRMSASIKIESMLSRGPPSTYGAASVRIGGGRHFIRYAAPFTE